MSNSSKKAGPALSKPPSLTKRLEDDLVSSVNRRLAIANNPIEKAPTMSRRPKGEPVGAADGHPCTFCKKKLDGDRLELESLGWSVHPACFFCNACRKPIEGPFSVDPAASRPVHPECYQDSLLPVCAGCKQKIQGQYLAVGGEWNRLAGLAAASAPALILPPQAPPTTPAASSALAASRTCRVPLSRMSRAGRSARPAT